MSTSKYDLHQIDYSCQGWDTIFSTDIGILDDEINTRILATLGETVGIYDALYLHTDGKYYKAKSDGTKQPALGLVLETGVADDEIRIQRIGSITDAGWGWSTVGAPVFLDASTAGALTETQPSTNAQFIGIVLSATSIFLMIELNAIERSLLNLSDTPASYDNGKYLRSTAAGTEWATVSADHSTLNELDYASSGHTGFSPDTHTHTVVSLSDTPAAYDVNKYLKSTTSGTEWATVSGGSGNDHSVLSNLGYGDSGHTGQLPIGEYDIKFDSLLSADGKYSGKTFDGVLGDTLAFGDLVYLNTADQRWEKADADAEVTSGDVDLAIVLVSGSDGDTRLLLEEGFVRENDWDFTSYGKALYISTISGTMTQTVVSGSGDIVRIVGYASTFADQIRFDPSKTWVELS